MRGARWTPSPGIRSTISGPGRSRCSRRGPGEAAEHFLSAAALARTSWGSLDSVTLPYAIDLVRVALDHAAVSGPEAFDVGARRVVRARALQRLADLYHALGRVPEGLQALREATLAFPHLHDNSLVLAQRLAAAGEGIEEAIAHTRGFVARYPFNFAARELLADLLAVLGRTADSHAVLSEAIQVLRLLHVEDSDSSPGVAVDGRIALAAP